MLTNYYTTNQCKHCLQFIIGKSFQTSLTNYNRTHSKQRLTTIIPEIILNDAYKLLSQNCLQKMLTTYYKRNYSTQCLQTIVRWILPNIMLTNYSQRNHSKHSLQNFIREIIPNNNYKLLSDNSFQTILNIPFVREIIPNKA